MSSFHDVIILSKLNIRSAIHHIMPIHSHLAQSLNGTICHQTSLQWTTQKHSRSYFVETEMCIFWVICLMPHVLILTLVLCNMYHILYDCDPSPWCNTLDVRAFKCILNIIYNYCLVILYITIVWSSCWAPSAVLRLRQNVSSSSTLNSFRWCRNKPRPDKIEAILTELKKLTTAQTKIIADI